MDLSLSWDQKFKQYLAGRISIDEDQWTRVLSVSRIKKLKKGRYLLQDGEVWNQNAFIVSGIVRIYTINDSGDEQILNFAKENWWTGDRESLLSGKPSRFNIDAIENTEVLLIGKDDFEKLCREIPAMGEMVYDIIQKSFIATQNRILIYKNYTAEQKYEDMMQRYPDFTTRIPLHMIASYLGIKAETLSRIRSQIVRK